jgi:hypothetical protein
MGGRGEEEEEGGGEGRARAVPTREEIAEVLAQLERGRLTDIASPDRTTRARLREQGVLHALLVSMRSGSPDVASELLHTIRRLIYRHPDNQVAAEKLGVFAYLLEHVTGAALEAHRTTDGTQQTADDRTQQSKEAVLQRVFGEVLAMVVDGEPHSLVGNHIALKWLFEVAQCSPAPLARVHAIRCLRNLLGTLPSLLTP